MPSLPTLALWPIDAGNKKRPTAGSENTPHRDHPRQEFENHCG
jgi:hypothetical protein